MSAGQPGPPALPGAEALDALLDGVARLGGAVSAAEAVVATGDEVLYRRASGFRVGGEPLVAASGARFDAASLTKPWMATLALALDAENLLPMSSRVDEIFELPAAERKAPTRGAILERLLRHQSGIAAWAPLGLKLGKRLADPAALVSFFLTGSFGSVGDESSTGEPPPEVYSDLGYILWGLAAERVTGQALSRLLDERVATPLGLDNFGALSLDPPNAVECRLDNGREVELAAEQGLRLAPQRSFHLGVPQDGNARALGRLAGHAGLFSTADELLALGREWLRPRRLLSAAARDRALAGEGRHALGWARWSADGSSGPGLSRSSFGHSGFTGGSLWIDPDRERIFVLLAHRLSSRIDFNPIRREFHRLAAGEL